MSAVGIKEEAALFASFSRPVVKSSGEAFLADALCVTLSFVLALVCYF